MKGYTFNKSDISNQTDIGEHRCSPVFERAGFRRSPDRKGKSFYKLNHQRMEELYYTVSESDLKASESDVRLSESDTDVSESDSDVSESDAIHSRKLHSRKIDSSDLDSSKLNTTVNLAVHPSGQTSSFSSSAQLTNNSPTVSGTSPEPFEKVSLSISGQTAREQPGNGHKTTAKRFRFPQGGRKQSSAVLDRPRPTGETNTHRRSV